MNVGETLPDFTSFSDCFRIWRVYVFGISSSVVKVLVFVLISCLRNSLMIALSERPSSFATFCASFFVFVSVLIYIALLFICLEYMYIIYFRQAEGSRIRGAFSR